MKYFIFLSYSYKQKQTAFFLKRLEENERRGDTSREGLEILAVIELSCYKKNNGHISIVRLSQKISQLKHFVSIKKRTFF